MSTKAISAEFPFESKFIEVRGSKIHYIDEGEGDPILFLHGNPTSNYLWRNIIPYVTDMGRAIAPDLIGMGKSDKPDIEYGFFASYKYIEGFIDGLGLDNITIVVHDWGSGLGFFYASNHPEKIKGIVFMESMVKEVSIKELPRFTKIMMRMMRGPMGYFMFVVMNMFVNRMLPRMIVRDLTKEEMAVYKAPFPTWKSRELVLKWPREIPIGGNPPNVATALEQWSNFLATTDIPKLGFYATPGAVIKEEVELKWVRDNMSNLELVHVGEGIHFLQEDHPHEIGEGLAKWYKEVILGMQVAH